MDTVNIIHDDRFFDRLPPLIKELDCCKIDYTVWAACIEKKNVLENITESFRRIVQDAKDKGLKRVIIAEDDLTLTCSNAWEYFLKNEPEQYDVYIGGSYLIDNRCKYEPPIVRVDSWVGNHLIMVNERYYDTWLSSKPDGHIDTEQSNRGEFYVCFPYVALQRPAMSANNTGQMVNYNSILENLPQYIYKG